NGRLMPIDGEKTTRQITLKPGSNVERVQVPPQQVGPHLFHATVEDVKNVSAEIRGNKTSGDTLPNNNFGDIFTWVRGKGKVLYVDNVANDGGQYLVSALAQEGIDCVPVRPVDFPTSPVE